MQKFPDAKQFHDFRKMFDEMEKDIDAVVVGTPDHTHAVAAMAAIKRGKHVYCEKPLAHSVYEVRQLMKAAKEHKVVTQLGNQGHSFETIRMFCEWIWDGAIGNVHTIHCGCSAVNSGIDAAAAAEASSTRCPPRSIGTCGWARPSSGPTTRPTCQARGAAGCPSATARSATGPATWSTRCSGPWTWARRTTIQAEAKDYDPKTQGDAYPKGEIITFEFPAKGKRGPITLYWYSGTEQIPPAADLEPTRKPVDTGAVVLRRQGHHHVRLARRGRRPDHPRDEDEGLQAARPRSIPRVPRPSAATGCRRSARARRPAPISPTAARSPRSPCWA